MSFEHTSPDAIAELPLIPGGWNDQRLVIAGHEFRLTLPAAPDNFLDDPKVRAAHARDDYMPYWCYLWPAAKAMAEAVLSDDSDIADGVGGEIEVLEIGAGIGLVGLAALARGWDVTLSDYDQAAVDVALHNARQNGYPHAKGMLLDWRKPQSIRVPLILGCDVVYEIYNHEPILDLLEVCLTADGVGWFGDIGRQNADNFYRLARDRGFSVEIRDEAGKSLPAPHVGRFQLIAVRRPIR